MTNLVDFAKHELKDMISSKESMNNRMAENILQLLEVFSAQGHSGFSASYCLSIFDRLSKFKPLTQLTGEDSEWEDRTEMNIDKKPLWQNKRYGSVFKEEDGRIFNSEGKIFEYPDGTRFTSKDSKVYITMPYMVTEPEVVKVDKDRNIIK